MEHPIFSTIRLLNPGEKKVLSWDADESRDHYDTVSILSNNWPIDLNGKDYRISMHHPRDGGFSMTITREPI